MNSRDQQERTRGNTFILKPSERDPSCGIRLAELMFEAGAPKGVLNVINGDKEAVDVLLSDPEVGAISFVGSTAIGRCIYETGCANGKRVQALCGAKNHMVIMPDADMDQAADAAMGAAYGSAGERCMAISVAVAVGDEAADAFVQLMAPKVHSLKMGAYNDPEAEMGPVVTAEAKARIEGYIDQGVESGAELVVDGRGVSLQGYENGFFVGGSLFDKVTTEMSIYKDEIFGPVLCVVRAENYEEAKKMTRDFIYVLDVAEALYILSINNNKHYKYNLSPNKKINIFEFGMLINKTLNYKVPPQIIKKNINFKEIPEQSIDGSLFQKEYNFKYTDLKTIIKKSFLEYKKPIF